MEFVIEKKSRPVSFYEDYKQTDVTCILFSIK